jgi:hypothetical protein
MNRREIEALADVQFRRRLNLTRRRHDAEHTAPGREDVLILLMAEIASQCAELNERFSKLAAAIEREAKKKSFRLRVESE